MTETVADLRARIDALPWSELERALADQGHAVIPSLLEESECAALIAQYARPELFRKRIAMQRHGYGAGEYQYFAYPLPEMVAELRQALYRRLSPIANRWAEQLGTPVRYPAEHQDYLQRCHAAGQLRPTPLLLKYGAGDYNRLHQDLYGEQVFPLQVAVLLSAPGRDFEGGELVLTEQRARMQSRPMVVPLGRGDAVVFAVHQRPARGARGPVRVQMRHGVSQLRAGSRHTLGVIFHDAS